MSVARISGPQLLDATLRTIQMPVNQQGVGVGADLRRNPGGQPYQGGGQRLPETKDPLQARKADLYSLPEPTPPLGWLGTQEDAYLGQSLPQFLAVVGQVAQESASHPLCQLRLVDEFFGQSDVCDVCGGKLVGERNPIGGTDEVQLHPIDAEGTPTYPRASGETRALRDLPGVQNRKQRPVHKQRLRVSDHLGKDLAAQRLQEAPELSHPSMQRGRMQPHHSGEQVRKESLDVAQERAFALHTAQVLQERQGKHLRVGELLERMVAKPAWVEEGVGVVDKAEQNGDCLFQGSEGGSMLRMGHPRFLSSGSRMALFLSHTESTQHTSRVAERRTDVGKVATGLTMSLDGFIAGPNDGPGQPLGEGGMRLFDWYSSGDTEYAMPGTEMVVRVSQQSADLLREAH